MLALTKLKVFAGDSLSAKDAGESMDKALQITT